MRDSDDGSMARMGLPFGVDAPLAGLWLDTGFDEGGAGSAPRAN